MKKLLLLASLFLGTMASAATEIHVADLSGKLKEGKDITAVLSATIRKMPDENVRLILPEGRFYLSPKRAFHQYLAITNHDNGEKNIAFCFEGKKNLTIEGQGTELIFRGHMLPFYFRNCENIDVSGVTIDWDVPFFVQGEVISTDKAHGRYTLRMYEDGYEWKVKDSTLVFPLSAPSYTYPGQSLLFDKERRAPVINSKLYDFNRYNQRIPVVENEDGTLTFYENIKDDLVPGAIMTFKGQKGQNRNAPAFFVIDSKNVRLHDLTIHHAKGMGVLCERSEDLYLTKVNVCVRKGSDRMVSTLADASHFCGCKGEIIMDGCRFESMLDDGTNVHGDYVEVTEILGRDKVKVKLGHFQQYGAVFAEAGDEVWFLHSPSMERQEVLKVKKTTVLDEVNSIIEFETPLPARTKVGARLENKTWNPELTVVRNCEIRKNRARCLVLKSPNKTIIEHNEFSSMMPALWFRLDTDVWYESGGTEDVIIRNNRFIDCVTCGTSLGVIAFSPKLCKAFNQGYPYKNILIQDNSFFTFDRCIISAHATDGMKIIGNKVRKSGTFAPIHPESPQIRLSRCKNVEIRDNDGLEASAWDPLTFADPQQSYGPKVWYHWQNGHVSKARITDELEAMKALGISGFTVFQVAEGVQEGPVPFNSEAWWEALGHAKKEARRLGLEMSIMNSCGWSTTAGPWVTPDKAMQEVAWTEKYVQGPAKIKVRLEEPVPVLGLTRDMKRDSVINLRYYVPRERCKGYYHDIAVLAYPTLAGEKQGKNFRIKDWVGKSGRVKMYQYDRDQRECPQGQAIDPDSIIDLTACLKADGSLEWEAPAGNWTILRIGYQPTGRQNHPAPPSGKGLEIDKMNPEALDLHWANFIQPILDYGEEGKESTISSVLIDSYEAGHQNWTAGFEKIFQERQGYDLLRFLPCITGRVVGSTAATEDFLWDFRKTGGALVAENFYGHYAELCHKAGVEFHAEHYGNFGNTNDFDLSKYVDVPASEFWALNFRQHSGTSKLSSSNANLYGRRIVGAESFSGMPEKIFETTPRNIKAQGDAFMCQGINQFWLHGFTHDPYNRAPGMTLGAYGSNFNDRNTLWPYAGEWARYITRCQYMLQNGRGANDILYYAGEDAPLRAEGRFRPAVPQGWDYDLCGADILASAMVEDGLIRTPGGLRYKMLVVRELDKMSDEVLAQLHRLEQAGAKVFMNPETDLQTALLQAGILPDFTYELYTADGQSVLADPVLVQDAKGKSFDHQIGFIHRQQNGSDLYFVHSLCAEPLVLRATFRVAGKCPQLWNAMTGEVEQEVPYEVTADGRTVVTLPLEEEGSRFVLFTAAEKAAPLATGEGLARVAAAVAERTANTTEKELQGSWEVAFKDALRLFPTLQDWSLADEPALKYYSGTAVYSKDFELASAPERGERIFIDLGQVEVAAKVFINGHELPVLWKYPYAAELTPWVKAGTNRLEIHVANTWVNRMIGDYKLPEQVEWTAKHGSTVKAVGLLEVPDWAEAGKPSPTGRETFHFWRWPQFDTKAPMPAGLLGPVKLKFIDKK